MSLDGVKYLIVTVIVIRIMIIIIISVYIYIYTNYFFIYYDVPPNEVQLIVRNWFVYIIYYNYNSLQQGNMRELQPRSWKALWVPMLFFTGQLQGIAHIWCWTPEARALQPSLHPAVWRELKTIDIHKGVKELQIKFPKHMMIVWTDITNYYLCK